MDNDKPKSEDQVVDTIEFSRVEDGCEDDLEVDGQQILGVFYVLLWVM